MPEGDTIHKIAAAMRPRLVGRTLRHATVRSRAWAGCHGGRIAGREVEAVYSHGRSFARRSRAAGTA